VRAIDRIDSSLRAAEELLTALLDISKLDAGALEPRHADFRVDDVLATLGVEFGIIARERGIEFRTVPSSRHRAQRPPVPAAHPAEFPVQRIALHPQGRVLLGCRRRGGVSCRSRCWTPARHPGEHLEKDIYEEFRRFQPRDEFGAKGMGLGLAIVQRMARALDHPIHVKSELGRGSMFAVEVPISATCSRWSPRRLRPRARRRASTRRSCSASTTSSILEGMSRLLEGWSCEVLTATDTAGRAGRCWSRPDARRTCCWPTSTSTAATRA
jgi:hypothetical protein